MKKPANPPVHEECRRLFCALGAAELPLLDLETTSSNAYDATTDYFVGLLSCSITRGVMSILGLAQTASWRIRSKLSFLAMS